MATRNQQRRAARANRGPSNVALRTWIASAQSDRLPPPGSPGHMSPEREQEWWADRMASAEAAADREADQYRAVLNRRLARMGSSLRA